MKKILPTILVIAAALPSFAADFTVTVPRISESRGPQVAPAEPTEGALQRAGRSGNPAQALNPLAPAEYGSGAGFVSHAENDPTVRTPHGDPRPVGIRLLSIPF